MQPSAKSLDAQIHFEADTRYEIMGRKITRRKVRNESKSCKLRVATGISKSARAPSMKLFESMERKFRFYALQFKLVCSFSLWNRTWIDSDKLLRELLPRRSTNKWVNLSSIYADKHKLFIKWTIVRAPWVDISLKVNKKSKFHKPKRWKNSY
jgi:hypothetical protein